MTALTIIDWLLFAALGIPALYLFVFAAAAALRRAEPFPAARKQHRFAVLIPAYKGDDIVSPTLEAALKQDYPRALFDVVLIADHFRPESLEKLATRPIRLLSVAFDESSKAKALNYAIGQIGTDYDVAAVLDVDNLVGPDFLQHLNNAYGAGIRAMQAHRTARNRDTDTAVLDAASEEINNSIFRRGHVALGLSSALIGSGMAFDYSWFRENIARCSTAGEDKELEVLLLRQRIYIDYLDYVHVYDEKVQQEGVFYNQRRRWVAAQFYALKRGLCDLPGALIQGNTDYADKLFQWMMPPRIVLLGLTPLAAVVVTLLSPWAAVKWWVLVLVLLFALAFALPDAQMDDRLRRALRKIPLLFLLMVANLFRIRGAGDRFIHTEHAAAPKDRPAGPDPLP